MINYLLIITVALQCFNFSAVFSTFVFLAALLYAICPAVFCFLQTAVLKVVLFKIIIIIGIIVQYSKRGINRKLIS